MDNAWLGLAGIVVAVAAMCGTLWQGHLLRRQLAQTEQISRSQFYHDITLRFVELNRLFVERPELWKYFHAGCAAVPAGKVIRPAQRRCQPSWPILARSSSSPLSHIVTGDYAMMPLRAPSTGVSRCDERFRAAATAAAQ